MKNFAALLFVLGMFFLFTFAGISPNSKLKINGGNMHSTNTDNSMSNANRQDVKYLPGKIIVKFKKEKLSLHKQMTIQSFASQPLLMKTMQGLGINNIEKVFPNEISSLDVKRVDLSTIYELNFDEGKDSWIVAAKLARDENVLYAEPHFIYELAYTPNDSLLKNQYHLELIQAEMAWDITQGNKEVVVAIVDVGVDWRHPDLIDNIWQNLGEDVDGDGHTIEFDGTYWSLDPGDLDGIDNDDFDGDPTSFIDDLIGWDFDPGGNDPSSFNDHGTHVAGIACAVTDNIIGIAGVGYKSKILPVKGSDYGTSITFGFEGIKYAVDMGADIINCSWGGPIYSNYGLDIVEYANEHDVLIVAAAGNSDAEQILYPAAYSNVMSIAATDHYDSKAKFTNYHYEIDVSAPGVSILSSIINEEYSTKSGTSMASPVVAGVASLVKSYHAEWSAQQIREQIRISSDDIYVRNNKYDKKLGYGRVNAYSALTKSSPAIRMTNFSFSDMKGGDGDGIIEPGEIIEVFIILYNYLEPAKDVLITLETDDSEVTLISNRLIVPYFNSGQTIENTNTPFEFLVGRQGYFGHEADFILEITANNGSYKDWDSFSLEFDPLYRDHDAGNVVLTLTSFGAIGYYDTGKKSNLGSGFIFPKESYSSLFHGSFLVGTGPSQISDASYGSIYHGAYDWRPVSNGNIDIKKDAVGNQIGFAKYNDIQASNPINILIHQNSYAYSTPPYDDFVIVEYIIENENEDLINDLYAAIYLDWDINSSLDDEVGYDANLSLGYMYDSNSYYYGVALIYPSMATSFRAIKNEDFVWPGFSDSSKFTFMTEGFQFLKSDMPNDWSQILSIGPYNISVGGEAKTTFAILGGENLEDLKNNVLAARKIYGVSESISGTVKYFEGNRAISDAQIILNDTDSTLTNTSGIFFFADPPQGNTNLSINKSDDLRQAISGSDVLLIMQNLAFNANLDNNQRIAADVTKDDLVSGSDVIALQRYLAFVDKGMGYTGEWIFSPPDTSFNFVDEATINFTAFFLGDCNGDWGQSFKNSITTNYKIETQNEVTLTKSALIKAIIKLPENTSGEPGSEINTPITVTTDSTIGFAQFVVEFDSTIIAFDTTFIGADASNLTITQVNTNLTFLPTGTGTNKNILVQISGGGTHTFAGNEQEVVILKFQIVDGPNEQSPLIFDKKGDRTFLNTSNLFDIIEDDIEFLDGNAIVTPVELVKFESHSNGDQIELVWTTISEANNLGFEIERSFDGYNYNKLTFIKGHGTTYVTHQYLYIDKNVKPGIYYYRLKQIDIDGNFHYIGKLTIEVQVPKDYNMSQNYPNPFNATTTIKYQLPAYSEVHIGVFNTLGKEVRRLVLNKQEVGNYSILWDGKNNNGVTMASGVYMYRIMANSLDGSTNFLKTKKMILLR